VIVCFGVIDNKINVENYADKEKKKTILKNINQIDRHFVKRTSSQYTKFINSYCHEAKQLLC